MGLRIHTNMASLSVLKYMRQAQVDTDKAMAQLASGSRVIDAGDDPAAFSISEQLKGQAKGLRASRMNAENAISFVQVAEGGLNEQNNIIIRMRELAVQAASDTVSTIEREMINDEFQQLLAEVDRVAKTTQYGSNKLLLGTGKSFEFQVGAYDGPENKISYSLQSNTTARALDLEDLSVAEKGNSLEAIEAIDLGLSTIGAARASFGAIQSRLQHAVDHLQSHELGIEQARSQMADTDVADAVSRMAMGQIRSKYQIAVLAQANTAAESALRLLE